MVNILKNDSQFHYLSKSTESFNFINIFYFFEESKKLDYYSINTCLSQITNKIDIYSLFNKRAIILLISGQTEKLEKNIKKYFLGNNLKKFYICMLELNILENEVKILIVENIYALLNNQNQLHLVTFQLQIAMISGCYQNLIFLMTLAITNDNKMLSKALQTLSAGAIASFLTQPFQVVKTNMIYSSIQRFNELHKFIIKNGWTQYMRGSSLAVLRQSYGFAIYTSIINKVNCYMDQHFLSLNKFYKYSIASLAGKFTAMLFEAPLTLLKTRREVMTSHSIKMEISIILKNPSEHISKGLGITLLREGVYSLLQYNMYRFFKDDLLMKQFNINSPFTAAFISGILSILISQPFEVIRSKISFSHGKLSIINCFNNQIKSHGWKGLWIGFLPRLVRKPINSGISWAIIQSIRSIQQI